jgi:carboxyl-terminal processing protease
MKWILFACFVAVQFQNTVSAESVIAANSVNASNATLMKDRYKNLELFQKIQSFVEKNYVDPVTNDALMTGAIKGMLETLDPHSNFLTPEVFRDVKIDTSGKFPGVGIEVVVKDDVLTVLAPMEGSPAWRAGIQAGDKIVKINGDSTKGFTLAEAVQKMRGKSGVPVTFTLFRKGWPKFKTITVKREIVKVVAVKSDELEPGYGYIRLAQFTETAAKDVEAALIKLEKQNDKEGLKGIVFDLRTNPGGLLDQAVDVTSLFMDEGVVVSTISRDTNQKDVRNARKGKARKELPVIVLVNSSTASAAEIVAAALQDHHRAMVIGDTTFGKGSVQTIVDLGNELGLKLTIARYYTPNGVSIQEKGVVPDIFLEEYDAKLLAKAKIKRDSTRERDLKGHLINNQGKEVRDEFTVQEFNDKLKTAEAKKIEDEEISDSTQINQFTRDDHQVLQALKYLKSYEVFKKIKKQ